MNISFIKGVFLWGFVLWLIGYILGILLFPFVPNNLIGWIIMPFGMLILYVLLQRKIKGKTYQDYFLTAVIWTIIAIAADYFLLVNVFHPADGYYKLDVYIYYALTFLLPLYFGRKRYARKSR